MTGGQKRRSSRWGTILVCILAIVMAGSFLYGDRHQVLSNTLQSWGIWGILASILLMMLICITPMPSEGLLVVLFKVYGVWWGILYAWIGAILSSFVVFELARQYGRPVLQSLITSDRFEQVDRWVRERGSGGLLAARLLPIPGFLLSYAVGTIPSVRLPVFVWTAAVSTIPYYVGAALIYLGISQKLIVLLFIGIAAVSVIWFLGVLVRQRASKRGKAGEQR